MVCCTFVIIFQTIISVQHVISSVKQKDKSTGVPLLPINKHFFLKKLYTSQTLQKMNPESVMTSIMHNTVISESCRWCNVRVVWMNPLLSACSKHSACALQTVPQQAMAPNVWYVSWISLCHRLSVPMDRTWLHDMHSSMLSVDGLSPMRCHGRSGPENHKPCLYGIYDNFWEEAASSFLPVLLPTAYRY